MTHHSSPITHHYVELHLHTAYSFLDGASQIEELLDRAVELEYPALAVTDHDNLAGAMAFAQYATSLGIQPITGAELTLDVDGRTCHLTLLAETPQGYANLCRLITTAWDPARSGKWDVGRGKWRGGQQEAGSRKQDGRGSSHFPRLTSHSFESHSLEGLIALSGCRNGLLCQLIDAGELGEAERAGRWLRDLFGPRSLYMELQRHLVQGDDRRVRRLVELAERLDVGVAATGNVHYHERARHRLQDAMVAIKHRSTLEGSHQLRRPNSEFFLRAPEEMAALFADLPQAIRATREIAERCRAFDLTKDLGYRFPEFRRDVAPGSTFHVSSSKGVQAVDAPPGSPLPAGSSPAFLLAAGRPAAAGAVLDCGGGDTAFTSKIASGTDAEMKAVSPPPQSKTLPGLDAATDADTVLAEFCREALDGRYPEGSEYRAEAVDRLRTELRLIQHHGLAGFFLVYRDLLRLAHEVAAEVRGADTARGASGLPPGRGRGSSVSSIVCYLIGLSHVDPVKNRLFLGRFLNEEMHSVPDIDLDFARDIREQLILRVYEHYGHDHAALVCSFSTYHIRSAVRDLGKVLGLPAPMLDKLAKLSEWGSAASVQQEMERLPELKDLVHVPIWQHLIELARQIASFPRHMSQHVGGMIISSRPIIELVPVQPAAMAGRYICQWDKDSCDDARFIKVDFLALGMLSLVEECLELIWQHRGELVDLSQIDHNDPEIYDQICAGDTVGLFQIESRAQIQMLPRTQPRNLDDLAIEVAIVRPGPIVGGAVNPYVRQRERQRQGATDYEVDHPLLKEVLRDTLGVVLFQDQVMEVAIELAGFSAGQADGLRRAMSRRRSAEAMQAFRDDFLNGASMRGVDEATATKVFDKLVGFSEFGFPKSHAAAFAVLAFQSAWLRYHYPAEYLCALFNNQPMGFYAPHVLVGDARRHGVQVLPIDVNRSGVGCSVEYLRGEAPPTADGGRRTAEKDDGIPASPLPSVVRRPPSIRAAAVRLGLDRVRSLGSEAAEAIVAERARGGPFRDLEGFMRRLAGAELKRPAMENLILLGAFPSFEHNRRELLWQYGLLARSSSSKFQVPSSKGGRGGRGRRMQSGTWNLELGTSQDMIERPEMGAWERMVTDYHTLGLSPSLHPLGLMRDRLPADIVTAEGLARVKDGARVRVAGLVVCRQRPGTAHGFTFLLLEDETGMANAIIRPPLYERKRPIIRGETMVIVRGRLQTRDGNINVLVEDIEPLREQELPLLAQEEQTPVPAIPPARSFR